MVNQSEDYDINYNSDLGHEKSLSLTLKRL